MSEIGKDSIAGRKSYVFALGIIKIYKYLTTHKKEFVLSKQLLRAGTSIGANVNEALSGESKKDFIHKLSIPLKEAKETCYWLDLLRDSEYLNQEQYTQAKQLCQELIKILSSIILTTKQKYLHS